MSTPQTKVIEVPVDLTPSPEALTFIVERFVEQVLDDVRKARKVSDHILLILALENVASLAQTNPAQVVALLGRLESKVPAGER